MRTLSFDASRAIYTVLRLSLPGSFALLAISGLLISGVGFHADARDRIIPNLLAQLKAVSEGDEKSVAERAVQLNDLGVRALERKDFKLAISKLEESVKLSPSYKTARENLGIAYNNYGLQLQIKPLDSIKQFHKAIYLDPQNETTLANFEGIIRYMHKEPESFGDRVSLGDQAMASGDWFGGVVEYSMALRLKDDAEVKSKLTGARQKLASYLRVSGIPSCAYWQAASRASQKENLSKIAGLPAGSPTTESGVAGVGPERDSVLQQAKELFEQYVLASDSHNPGIVKLYAKDAHFAMGGSDPRVFTAKLKVPAEQWKERFLTRQRRDGVVNNKDKFENVTYRAEQGGVRISFTRVEPQVTARVEWLVKQDTDHKWRIFEQTELAVRPSVTGKRAGK